MSLAFRDQRCSSRGHPTIINIVTNIELKGLSSNHHGASTIRKFYPRANRHYWLCMSIPGRVDFPLKIVGSFTKPSRCSERNQSIQCEWFLSSEQRASWDHQRAAQLLPGRRYQTIRCPILWDQTSGSQLYGSPTTTGFGSCV